MRHLVLAFAALLLAAVPASAQDQLSRVIIQGGYSSFNVRVAPTGRTPVNVAIDGFYGSAAARVGERAELYGVWNQFNTVGTFDNVFQLGTQFRLGPARWQAKPSIRVGIINDDGETRPSAGIQVRLGRRYGAALSADYSRMNGYLTQIFQIGAYVGLGEY